MDAEIERRHARLYHRGGSRSVTLPKAWLDDMRIATDEVDLVYVDGKIVKEQLQ